MPFSIPTNQEKHFEGQKVESFLNLKMNYLDGVRSMHTGGVSISHKMLHFYAQEIAKIQGITHPQFKVSRS
jgi:hypothetical protein